MACMVIQENCQFIFVRSKITKVPLEYKNVQCDCNEVFGNLITLSFKFVNLQVLRKIIKASHK